MSALQTFCCPAAHPGAASGIAARRRPHLADKTQRKDRSSEETPRQAASPVSLKQTPPRYVPLDPVAIGFASRDEQVAWQIIKKRANAGLAVSVHTYLRA
ncbi:MAG TPA: hypothetical protein VGF67_13125 [Ktedonobacteraceae bacterium]